MYGIFTYMKTINSSQNVGKYTISVPRILCMGFFNTWVTVISFHRERSSHPDSWKPRHCLVGGWTNPLWKIWYSQIGSSPQGIGVKIKKNETTTYSCMSSFPYIQLTTNWKKWKKNTRWKNQWLYSPWKLTKNIPYKKKPDVNWKTTYCIFWGDVAPLQN